MRLGLADRLAGALGGERRELGEREQAGVEGITAYPESERAWRSLR